MPVQANCCLQGNYTLAEFLLYGFLMECLFTKNKGLKPVPTKLVAGNHQVSFRIFSPTFY